jgi:hypothetical protein
MAQGKSEISIERSPDEIWKVIRDFGGLANYMPGVDSCTVDGDVRTLQMMGIEIKEQLRCDRRRQPPRHLQRRRVTDEQHASAPGDDRRRPEGSGSHVSVDRRRRAR